MSARYVAFLRGINVGRAKRVAMADLKRVVESLGHEDVATVLNSGNVVFSAAGSARPKALAHDIERAVEAELGVASRVTVVTAEELAVAIADNPLAERANDPSRLMLSFTGGDIGARLAHLAEKDWSPEALAVGGRVAYSWCPDGVSNSPLLDAVAKALGDDVTTRNWATVLRLQRLLDAGS